MLFENRNYAIAGAFVDELARCGLRHVCVCPGSRSSPLAISLARHTGIKTWVHLDERSASFFALGMALTLREPIALVCTSGTAAANFHPAVIEAHYSRVPLLILTSDRPPEIVDWGAPQAMDQLRLYGSHAKWWANMPPPEATRALMAFARSTACRAFTTSLASPAGPVHINFPFREPLEPSIVPGDFPSDPETMDNDVWRGRADGQPYIRVSGAVKQPTAGESRELAAQLSALERGLIVIGPQPQRELAEGATTLARLLQYPILADPLSQARCGHHDRSLIIDSYDAFLRDSGVAESLVPEVVIRFGAPPTTKPLTQYLERHGSARHILVDGGDGWRDPSQITGEVVHTDPAMLCSSLASALNGERPRPPWTTRWLKAARAARIAMDRELAGFHELFEGKVFAELARLLPEDSILFAGNSMPVRDMDTFFPSTAKGVRFMGNRGVNGIDGVVSTALGASAASRGRLVLVIGDISFYHDMNGLLAAKAHALNSTIIVINNDGGGIFSFLPQAAYEDVFEPYFGTPHGLTFQSAAQQYGLSYHKIESWEQFRSSVAQSLSSNGTTIVEVPGDRSLNVVLHRRVWPAVASAVHAEIKE